ncbi:MAG: 4-hydroxythreonine-4-phosphate dehydrogenase PdxA [Proteobacteria bacterium]|nr:4-hydroxythreonine-4-phosphate dehydrogenase PdxA [Pseudomonadota bacterium]
MTDHRPIIGITMGDPVGIGPEIIIKAFSLPSFFEKYRPLVLGDTGILSSTCDMLEKSVVIRSVETPATGEYSPGAIDVINLSTLDPKDTRWGNPTEKTGRAMTQYILKGIDLALSKEIHALVTCPINKLAMNMAGYAYNGHTELLAERTHTGKYAMMLAGDKLRVVLVTIHMPLKDVAQTLSIEKIIDLIRLTDHSLKSRFGIAKPRIAVAGFNPHASEDGMFGQEEKEIIAPAIDLARKEGFLAEGPFPPDTIYFHAAKGAFDVVVSMYHDQGLIPFKLLHFEDGVNTTLGLPIIRTSVDHGTAYDISGKGIARPDSLIAAVKMASTQALCVF